MLVWTPVWCIPYMTLCSICMRTIPSQILQYGLQSHAAFDLFSESGTVLVLKKTFDFINLLVLESLWCASCQPGILHRQHFGITFSIYLLNLPYEFFFSGKISNTIIISTIFRAVPL